MAFTYAWKLVFATLFMLQLSGYQATARTLPHASSMVERHEQWIAQHGRAYKDDTEKVKRFKIFKENVEYIESFNEAGVHNYKLGINKFADLTNEEFRAARTGYKRGSHPIPTKVSSFKYANVSAVPPSMDWRKKGAVTDIKDQGTCGSCWAFSAVAATEGINQLTTGKLVSLSEQELMDCDTSKDQACHGGFMDTAFEFIVGNKGLTTESNYPYRGVDSICNKQKEYPHIAKITGYEDVPTNSEPSLLKAVAHQPVSVAIDSSGIQFYSSGVYTGECGTNLDHAVTAIGYGQTSNGTQYWLVKNSWGSNWGEAGYFRMERGISAAAGICGIAKAASYPTA